VQKLHTHHSSSRPHPDNNNNGDDFDNNDDEESRAAQNHYTMNHSPLLSPLLHNSNQHGSKLMSSGSKPSAHHINYSIPPLAPSNSNNSDKNSSSNPPEPENKGIVLTGHRGPVNHIAKIAPNSDLVDSNSSNMIVTGGGNEVSER